MAVVAIDASGPGLVVAVQSDGDRLPASHRSIEGRAQQVVSVLDELLAASDLVSSDVTRVGIAIGPGSFTSIRIAVVTARGLATSVGADIVPLPSLAVRAASVEGDGERWGVVDGQRGEVFAQAWTTDQSGPLTPVSPLHVVRRDQLESLVGTDHWNEDLPAADQLIRLTHAGATKKVAEVVPEYGREPDAVPSRTPTVSRLTLEHRHAAVGLLTMHGAAGWSSTAWEDQFTSGRGDTWAVMGPAGDVAGVLHAQLIADAVHILDVAVHPDRRRRGIGRMLVREVMTPSYRSAADVTLEVEESNAAAIALYRSMGFVEEGRRTDYYGAGRDALVMWCRGAAE